MDYYVQVKTGAHYSARDASYGPHRTLAKAEADARKRSKGSRATGAAVVEISYYTGGSFKGMRRKWISCFADGRSTAKPGSTSRRSNPSKTDHYKLVRSRQRHLGHRLWDVIDTKKGVRVVNGETFTIASQACASYNGDSRGVAGEIQEWARPNPSHPDCPGVSARHQHYQGKCATDWNLKGEEWRKTWPAFGAWAKVFPMDGGLWGWLVVPRDGATIDGEAKSVAHAKKWCVSTIGRMYGRSTSRRSNPSLGMPGMPHTWVTENGVKVHGGDTVEFWVREGGHGNLVAKKATAKVNKMLIFDDHVQVNRGWAGTTVDDRNFIRVVRRA